MRMHIHTIDITSFGIFKVSLRSARTYAESKELFYSMTVFGFVYNGVPGLLRFLQVLIYWGKPGCTRGDRKRTKEFEPKDGITSRPGVDNLPRALDVISSKTAGFVGHGTLAYETVLTRPFFASPPSPTLIPLLTPSC